MLFTQDQIKNNKEIKAIQRPSERFKRLKEIWKELGKSKDMDRYRQMAEEDRQRVMAEMEAVEEEVSSDFDIELVFKK